jgi:hypothetical protein
MSTIFPSGPSGTFILWRASLARLLAWFDRQAATGRRFYAKLFGLFIALNMGCYWWALLTAYPEKMWTHEAPDILLMSLPVSVLGGLFDFLSLFVTLFMARRAVASTNNASYMGYLSVDLVIAIAATAWVLFVFTILGWMVNLVLAHTETLAQREVLYKGRFWAALMDPFHPESLRNIYFGIVMGASAMLPTLIHLFHALRALGKMVFAVPTPPSQP